MKQIFIQLILLFSVMSFGQTIDREVITASGGYHTTDNSALSWTLGDLAVETYISNSLILSQGFQQGHLNVNAVENIDTGFTLKAYPNPVKDILIIETQAPDKRDYQIIDANGRIIENGIMIFYPFELDFTNRPSGIYFLKVDQNITHKIVKQ